ncbi:MAG: YccF family protein [Kiritimatiellae bacterium]|nr:YccF family protein [Kiritimatiellia bacterium]
MAFIGNLLWFVCGGFVMGCSLFILGLLWCCTIVGIPVGVALFRMASFAFLPFGKDLVAAEDVGETRVLGTGLMSFLWIVLFGFWTALSCAVAGLLLCCTVIGIPFGLAYFKLAKASFNPLGKRVVPMAVAEEIRRRKVQQTVNAYTK